MKVLAFAAAGVLAATGIAAVPAMAQTTVHTRTVTRTTTHRGHRWRYKTVCRTHWYRHRKVRRCERVRVRG